MDIVYPDSIIGGVGLVFLRQESVREAGYPKAARSGG